MSEPRAVLFTTGELAARLGAELQGSAELRIRGLETLSTAGPEGLSFIRDVRHWPAWSSSNCGAALVSRAAMERAPELAPGRAWLIVKDADTALIEVLTMFAVPATITPGVHSSAVIDPTATVAAGASIGPHVSIGAGSTVGAGTVLHAGVQIGSGVTIGSRCVLHHGVSIQDRCVLMDHIILHAGVVIGADGFGYRPDPSGRGIMKIPHIGNVLIESHVEVGANTTIDRGKFGATRIGAGTKIDNLVQIGHNCNIGRCCIICGMCGLAGSVTLQDGVTLAGCVGVADNKTIGMGATIAARSGVMHDIPPGETWAGYPARPAKLTMRIIATLDHLPDMVSQVKKSLKSPS